MRASAGRHVSRGLVRGMYWAAVCAWAAAIFALSSVPGSRVPGRYGTLAHFVEYAVLAMLLYGALRLDRSKTQAALLAVVIASAYGITDEIHQSFVPLRVPDPRDWVTDTAGAVTAVLALLGIERLARRRG
jgi:VanZ family protein